MNKTVAFIFQISNRRIIFTLLVLMFNTIYAQNLTDYSIEEVDWKKWDTMYGDNKAKLDFVGKYYVENRIRGGSSISFAPAEAKILDMDGDGNPDMIYFESDTTWIYLNKNDSLNIILSIKEKISEISKSWPDAPINFKTIDLSCCIPGEWEINFYQFFFEGLNFNYRVYRTEIIRQGTKDLFRNMPPTQIKVAAASADMVLAPGSTEIIETYKTGRNGYAVASIKDENGRLWWKVFIKEADYKLRAGWIDKNKLVPVYQK